MARQGRIVQLKAASSPFRAGGKKKIIEGTIRQSRFGADVSFDAPASMIGKLKLGTIVSFEGLPRKPHGRTVDERKVKILKIIK